MPLLPVKGYPSITFLHDAAAVITDAAQHGKDTHTFYFGDYDPSGVDIYRNVTERLQEYAPTAVIHFSREAVTPEQIENWELPARPTKKSDSRAKNFGDMSVELDAIEPEQLRQMVTDCIERVVDYTVLQDTLDKQKREKTWINNFVKNTDFE